MTQKAFFLKPKTDFIFCFFHSGQRRRTPSQPLAASRMKIRRELRSFSIKIAGKRFLRGRAGDFSLIKARDTCATDAGFVAQVGRYLCNQFFRDFDFCAPARRFVTGFSAKHAIIWLMTQRTLIGGVHFINRISGRKRPTNWFGIFVSMEFARGFSRSTWPSQKTTSAFC